VELPPFLPPFLQTVLHKQTQGSLSSFSSDELVPLWLFLSLEVLFLLIDSLLFDELDELLVELEDELELLVELEEVELCFFSYSSRSCLRFCSHSEFSDAPLFLNLQTFKVTLLSSTPIATANSGEQPFPLAGGFKT
jgi:hypothetical protein